jgi:uncharacterized protein with PQ loop repeat
MRNYYLLIANFATSLLLIYGIYSKKGSFEKGCRCQKKYGADVFCSAIESVKNDYKAFGKNYLLKENDSDLNLLSPNNLELFLDRHLCVALYKNKVGNEAFIGLVYYCSLSTFRFIEYSQQTKSWEIRDQKKFKPGSFTFLNFKGSFSYE